MKEKNVLMGIITMVIGGIWFCGTFWMQHPVYYIAAFIHMTVAFWFFYRSLYNVRVVGTILSCRTIHDREYRSYKRVENSIPAYVNIEYMVDGENVRKLVWVSDQRGYREGRGIRVGYRKSKPHKIILIRGKAYRTICWLVISEILFVLFICIMAMASNS